MLVKSLRLLIANGKTDGLREKIDTLWMLGRLTRAEYDELVNLMGGQNA